jgi:hypothetical protein
MSKKIKSVCIPGAVVKQSIQEVPGRESAGQITKGGSG